MLQWMGGSKRKVTTSRKSTQKRQKQYFEQRKRQQQQQQHYSSGRESYFDKKVPCGQSHENNRSLDILSLLNVSKKDLDHTSRFPEGGSTRGEHSTPNHETVHCPNTVQTETQNLCPSDHAEIRETRIASNHQGETVCPQDQSEVPKRNDGKDQLKMATDHKLSVVDILGDDGQNSYSRESLAHEDHVAFSVEGLGGVEMETPVHSPQQPTRNFSYGYRSPSKFPKGSHSSTNLNCRLEDQFPELDDMAVDVEIPTYLGELYASSKQKVTAGKESLLHDVKDFLSHDNFYHCRMERDEYKWHEKSSFLDDKFFDDDCGLPWKHRPYDLDSSMVNCMRSRNRDKPDFSFEGLQVQKKRTSLNAAGRFSISELSSPYKHQTEHSYDFTTSNMTRYPTIDANCEFSDITNCSARPSFATEDARDSLRFSSQESCLPGAVWREATKNALFNSTARRKIRVQEADFRSPVNQFSIKKNTFIPEFCKKRINIKQQESFIGLGDDWLFEEDTFDSDFNPKLYQDNTPSTSRSKHNVFSGDFLAEKISFCQEDNPGHTSTIHKPFDGHFKEDNDFSKTQLPDSISTEEENKSVTQPIISRKLHEHEDNHSFATSVTPINIIDSEINSSRFQESKVKTPEMTTGLKAVRSPERSEGASSSVEMPQKLEDTNGIKECQNDTQISLPSQSGHKETEDSGHRKGDLSIVDRSCKVMMLGSFVLQLL